jgi:2-dehydro-3-deoxyphosphogalactonate aldolase
MAISRSRARRGSYDGGVGQEALLEPEVMSLLIDALAPLPLLAILRGLPAAEAPALADRLLAAGLRVLEVPLNRPGALDSLRALVQHVGSRGLVGAGSVLRPAQVADVAAAGGRFVVMPHGDPLVIEACRRAALPCVPGVATPSEAFAALAAGAAALKLFPAQSLPPAVVAAWRAVLPPEAWLIMVGGITLPSISPYRAAGAQGFGLGSVIYQPGKPLDEVERAARSFVNEWQVTRADHRGV